MNKLAGNSRKIVSNQDSPHPDLIRILDKHRQSPYRKPVAAHSRAAFEQLLARMPKSVPPIILDSGCGTGESTVKLAARYPNHAVIGIDKSALRLSRFESMATRPVNAFVVRADLFDFWRLLRRSRLPVSKHYVLYPNPWPKKRHLARRYHGHPAFFDLLALGSIFELRSNWKLYLDEWRLAFAHATGLDFPVRKWRPDAYLTPFERKYASSGQDLFVWRSDTPVRIRTGAGNLDTATEIPK